MSRHLRRLPAACLTACVLAVVAGLAVPAMPASARARAAQLTDPLSVTIDAMSPSAISSPEQRGRITLRGRVRNNSDEPWSDLVAYVVPGTAPMRTEGELAAAVASDPLTPFGNRLVEDGLYVRLPNLAPGQSAPYRLSVPIRALGLSGGRGVYWIGVHILGTSLEGRVDGADGRARTFLPLMRSTASPASVDVIVPFRQKVVRAFDGHLLRSKMWSRLLSPGGRLSNLLDLAAASPFQVSLLVDPAVTDAADSLAAGNPTNDGKQTADPDQAAIDWLRSFRALTQLSDLLALPYGDVDVAAAVDEDQTEILNGAVSASRDRLQSARATSVLAPMTGFLSQAQLEALGGGHTVLLDPAATPDADGPAMGTTAGPQVVVGDPLLTPAVAGDASLADLRQLLLARLAVRSLSGTGDVPIVVDLPTGWDPGTSGDTFFRGLEVPWVRGTSLATVKAAMPTEPYDAAAIVEPDGVDDSALPISNFLAATDLTDHGSTLAALLAEPAMVPLLARQSLLAVSEHVRTDPSRARAQVNRASTSIDARLGEITLSGPNFVTLSSDTGTFQVTISNGLDRDVTVGIVGNSGTRQLRIKAPAKVTVPAGQRRSVRVTATAHRLGVFRVTIRPTTEDGQLLPREIVLSVRSSQVGQVLWLVFGAAGGILFIAIGLRVIRRIRGRRRERD